MKNSISKLNSYTHRAKNFTTIQNEIIRSNKLSCKAFKLLCIGLSHSGNWSFKKEQIATCFKEGDYTLDQAMKELRSIGYLHLKAKIEDNKFTGHHWFWFDEPVSEEEFKLFLRDEGFQGVEETSGSENIGDIRKPISKNTKLEKKTNYPAAPASPSAVVVSSLDKLNLKDSLKKKLVKEHSKEDLDKAVERSLAWSERESDEAAILTALKKKETWKDRSDPQVIVEENKKHLNSLRHLDNAEIKNTRITIGKDYIEFVCGRIYQIFKTESKDFILSVNSYFKNRGLDPRGAK